MLEGLSVGGEEIFQLQRCVTDPKGEAQQILELGGDAVKHRLLSVGKLYHATGWGPPPGIPPRETACSSVPRTMRILVRGISLTYLTHRARRMTQKPS